MVEGPIRTTDGRTIHTTNSTGNSVNPEKSRHSEFIRNIKNDTFRAGHDKIKWNKQGNLKFRDI